MSLRKTYLAAVEHWKSGVISDDAAIEAMRAFESTPEGRAYFSGPAAPSEPEPSGSSSIGGAPVGTVTIDSAAYAELIRQAAAAPALMAAAQEALRAPVTAVAPPRSPVPPTLLSAPPGGQEPSEEAWQKFFAGQGLPYGGAPAAPGAALSAPGVSDADLDRFVDGLPGLGRSRP